MTPALRPRERRLLVLAGIVGLAIAGYVYVVEPLVAAHAETQELVEARTTLLERQRGWNVIESVSEIERERMEADWEQISRLTDPSAPLYGLTTVGAVVCNRWLRIDVRSGHIATGFVDGHTTPCDAQALPPPSAVGLQVLLDLEAEGVELPAPALRSLRNGLRTVTWRAAALCIQ